MIRNPYTELERLRTWVGEVNHVAQHTAAEQHRWSKRFEDLEEDLSEATNVGRSVASLGRRLTRADEERGAELTMLRDQVRHLVRLLADAASAGDLTASRPGLDDLARVLAAEPTVVPQVPTRSVDRLQLGTGGTHDATTTCFDTHDLPGVDLVVRPHRLPVAPGSVSSLVLRHFLERFDEDRLRSELLPHWFGLLAPGAEVRVVARDVDAMVAAWRDGALAYEQLRLAVAGPDPATRPHRSAYTSARLVDLLVDAGLSDVSVDGEGSGALGDFEMVVVGIGGRGR